MSRPTLPRLPDDPDARLVRWGWIAWGVVTAILVIRYLVMDRDAGSVLFATSIQLVALWLLWPLYRGTRALWHWMRDAPFAEWNGSYYEYDGQPIRVLFDDEDIYVVAADVFDALAIESHAADERRVRVAAGRDGLRRLPGRRETVFSERGLAAWMERRTDEKSAKFRRWFDAQVVAPYRKRRERGG